ncbi:MAG: IS66 family transposase zinc-finger binding domain-containing protein [Sedimentisphaerales bacterium]|nr:IS66 family transposase zinc-finger binding domain-containing protein [Sedimentisphaerales bacterium]
MHQTQIDNGQVHTDSADDGQIQLAAASLKNKDQRIGKLQHYLEQLQRIGAEKSEQLDYIPASLRVIEHVRFKYACKHCEQKVVTADKAYAGYNFIFDDPVRNVIELLCWAHARRKFYDARKNAPQLSHTAIAWIKLLYDVEKEIKGFAY